MRSEDHYFFSQLSPEPRWNCTETRVAPVCPPGNGEQKDGVKGGFTPLTIDQFFLSLSARAKLPIAVVLSTPEIQVQE